jgi:hypothetical protein
MYFTGSALGTTVVLYVGYIDIYNLHVTFLEPAPGGT